MYVDQWMVTEARYTLQKGLIHIHVILGLLISHCPPCVFYRAVILLYLLFNLVSSSTARLAMIFFKFKQMGFTLSTEHVKLPSSLTAIQGSFWPEK